MILISHPYESETRELMEEREKFGMFLTAHITNFFAGHPVINFPLTWYRTRMDLGLQTSDADACRASLEFIGRADAVIFIRFPGIEVCPRMQMERKAALRTDTPMAELPFYRHRFEQQLKQNALLADQKRVLNLLHAAIKDSL